MGLGAFESLERTHAEYRFSLVWSQVNNSALTGIVFGQNMCAEMQELVQKGMVRLKIVHCGVCTELKK